MEEKASNRHPSDVSQTVMTCHDISYVVPVKPAGKMCAKPEAKKILSQIE